MSPKQRIRRTIKPRGQEYNKFSGSRKMPKMEKNRPERYSLLFIYFLVLLLLIICYLPKESFTRFRDTSDYSDSGTLWLVSWRHQSIEFIRFWPVYTKWTRMQTQIVEGKRSRLQAGLEHMHMADQWTSICVGGWVGVGAQNSKHISRKMHQPQPFTTLILC